MGTNTLVLLDEVSADGNGEWKEWSGTGEGTLHIEGTWGGATVTIQGTEKINGVIKTAIAPNNSAFTENTRTEFSMGKGLVRAVVSGSGTTSLSAYLTPPERP